MVMGKIGLTRDNALTKNLLSFENIKEKIPRWTPTRAELGGCLPQPNLDKIPQSCTTSTMQCLSEIKEVDITHLYTINRWSLSGSKHLLALLFCANNKMWMEKSRAFSTCMMVGTSYANDCANGLVNLPGIFRGLKIPRNQSGGGF